MKLLPDQIVTWLQQLAPAAELSADSRSIGTGDVFFAFPGDTVDGRRFIDSAIERGAAAIVYEAADVTADQIRNLASTPALAVDDLKQLAGEVAAHWYRLAAPRLFVAAVTGTNGKTSCSQWLASALSRLGSPSAVVGTLGTGVVRDGVPDTLTETGYTTPDAILLQRRLRDMQLAGARSVAIEASSIGLDQGRMSGLSIDVALFTNFTRDHLDYHGDMTRYEAAKTRLFDWPGLQHAVLNLDDAMGARLHAYLRKVRPSLSLTAYTLTETIADGCDMVRASDIRSSAAGLRFQLHTPLGSSLVKTQLVGNFNVSNVLGVVSVLLSRGYLLSAILPAIEALTAVPGRMQQFGGDDLPLVVIDYAHTPDALEKTLTALREVAQQRGGELWCLFGCGGDRDAGKRPQMGAIAQAADHIILTSDNPRSEAPTEIIAQIAQGIDQTVAGSAPQIIEDRATAILWAVRHAGKADVILLAGKGHENYQEIRGKKLPFLDADHTALALATRARTKAGQP